MVDRETHILPGTEAEAFEMGIGRISVAQFLVCQTDQYFRNRKIGVAKTGMLQDTFRKVLFKDIAKLGEKDSSFHSICTSAVKYFGLDGFGDLREQLHKEYLMFKNSKEDNRMSEYVREFARATAQSLENRGLRVRSRV